jgi:hypothetical protein
MTPQVAGQTLGISYLILIQFRSLLISQFVRALCDRGFALSSQSEVAKKSLVGILAKVARNASGIQPWIPASRNCQLAGDF